MTSAPSDRAGAGALRLALAGCGGMGRRHIRGLRKLQEIGREDFRLTAVCDPFSANALLAADLAEELLGDRPQIFASIDDLIASGQGVDALILTTAPDTHAPIGVAALEAGLHLLVEKPIALTVRQGQALIEAAARTGRVLAVAENYRRDPVNRLAKAAIDAGLLGRVYLAVQSSSGSGGRVIITPWRHLRRSGGIVVDMGIHYADILEYLLGPIDRVVGMNAIVDATREDDAGNVHDVDAEDLSVGVAQFQSGAIANWMIDLAGRGDPHFTRMIYGTNGSLAIPHDRSGKPLRLIRRANGSETALGPDDVLSLLPEYALDSVTASLFGGERLATYDLAFPDIDANLLAIEQADFADAVRSGRPPEVDGLFGLRSLAIAYGFIESERLGRILDIDTLLTGQDSPYQNEIMSATQAK
jgi:predicted dehydrogenase